MGELNIDEEQTTARFKRTLTAKTAIDSFKVIAKEEDHIVDIIIETNYCSEHYIFDKRLFGEHLLLIQDVYNHYQKFLEEQKK